MPFPGLAPFLIPNYPETNESPLSLGGQQGALLLVSHCSCPDTSPVAPGNVPGALPRPDPRTQLSAAPAAPLDSVLTALRFRLPWTLSRQRTQRPLCPLLRSASRLALLVLSSSSGHPQPGSHLWRT